MSPHALDDEGPVPVVHSLLDDAVLWDGPAGCQLSPREGHRLGSLVQSGLLLEQPIASRLVPRGLSRKRIAHDQFSATEISEIEQPAPPAPPVGRCSSKGP